MKKYFYLMPLFCMSFFTAQAIIHTNKTFMTVPTPHSYLPMQYSSWHRIIKQGSSSENPWNSTIQAAPFYRTSKNDSNLGKYFGTNYDNTIYIGYLQGGVDLQKDLIMHRWKTAPSLEGKLHLNPEHTAYGVYLSYNQELNNINDNLFLRINLPFEHVKNNLRPSVTNETKDNYTGSAKGILDYFSGSYTQTAADNKQEALTHAKITDLNSHSGIADVELLLGYKLVEQEEYEAIGYAKIIMPTGNTPSGVELFQAIVGNNNHWGLGAGMNTSLNITKGADYSLELILNADFLYLFSSDEKRTLGFRNGTDRTEGDAGREDTAIRTAWSYYLLGGEDGKAGTFPLANVLTQDVSVHPGSRLQGHVSFAYHRNNTTFDFGYSFIAKEGEKVKIKSWENDKYGPAYPTYDTTEVFSVTNPARVYGGPIQEDELETEPATTPAFLKHAIHGALSYTLSERETPLVMGCGFAIDWTKDNATPVGYTLWAKAGITF